MLYCFGVYAYDFVFLFVCFFFFFFFFVKGVIQVLNHECKYSYITE
jgi:hypothetical protein